MQVLDTYFVSQDKITTKINYACINTRIMYIGLQALSCEAT